MTRAMPTHERQPILFAIFRSTPFVPEFLGRNFGIPSELLEYDPSKINAMTGVAMLHGVLTRPTNEIELTYISPIWRALSDFGVNKAEWHPYWNNEKLVTEEAKQVKLSFYSRPEPDGHAPPAYRYQFIEPGCGGERAIKQEHALGSVRGATDALTHQTLTTTDHTVTIPLAASQWRMIEVR